MIDINYLTVPLFYNYCFEEPIGHISINKKQIAFLLQFPNGYELQLITNEKKEILGLSIITITTEKKKTESEKCYTTFKAAKLLGVSGYTVINWINEGKIKCFKTPGGHRRITHEEISRLTEMMDHLGIKKLGRNKKYDKALKKCNELIEKNK